MTGGVVVTRTLGAWTLGLSALAGPLSAAFAAQVEDIPPQAIRSTAQAKGVTLVLFTSPDKGCGYCAGQRELFDQFAKTYDGPVRLRAVQWSPWRAFPADDLFQAKVYGIPQWQVYRDGALLADISGKMADAGALRSKLDAALRGELVKPKAPEPAAPAKPADPPLTEAERHALGLMVRRDLARAAFDRCRTAQPGDAQVYGDSLAAFEARHRDALDHSARLMLKRSGPGSSTEMRPIVDAEARRLKDEAPMESATADGCRRLAQALSR